jgi:DNA-directed RNA polymerase subunit RPC12/RpoP
MDEHKTSDDLRIPADLLRSFLGGRDVPCPQCDYNLRDLAGTRCPECGEEIVLRVNLSEPKQKLLIAGLVGLSAGAGLNGLLVIYWFIQEYLIRRGGPNDNPFLVTTVIGFIVEGAAMALWLVKWRRIRRASSRTRIFFAILCWVLTLFDILWFSFTIT